MSLKCCVVHKLLDCSLSWPLTAMKYENSKFKCIRWVLDFVTTSLWQILDTVANLPTLICYPNGTVLIALCQTSDIVTALTRSKGSHSDNIRYLRYCGCSYLVLRVYSSSKLLSCPSVVWSFILSVETIFVYVRSILYALVASRAP